MLALPLPTSRRNSMLHPCHRWLRVAKGVQHRKANCKFFLWFFLVSFFCFACSSHVSPSSFPSSSPSSPPSLSSFYFSLLSIKRPRPLGRREVLQLEDGLGKCIIFIFVSFFISVSVFLLLLDEKKNKKNNLRNSAISLLHTGLYLLIENKEKWEDERDGGEDDREGEKTTKKTNTKENKTTKEKQKRNLQIALRLGRGRRTCKLPFLLSPPTNLNPYSCFCFSSASSYVSLFSI